MMEDISPLQRILFLCCGIVCQRKVSDGISEKEQGKIGDICLTISKNEILIFDLHRGAKIFLHHLFRIVLLLEDAIN